MWEVDRIAEKVAGNLHKWGQDSYGTICQEIYKAKRLNLFRRLILMIS